MKKNVFACILSMVLLFGISSVANAQTIISVNDNLSSPVTSCNPKETTNYYWYLTDDGSRTKPADDFWVSGFDALILNSKNGSSIEIWRNGDVLNDCNTWRRMSNIVKNGDKVVAFQNQDKCVFNIPSYIKTGYDTIDAQIHFTIGYRKVRNDGPTPLDNQTLFYKYRDENNYHCYPNGNSVSDANTCAKTNVKHGGNNTHIGECQNYRLFRCGDGLVSDNSIKYSDGLTHVESCDPNAPEWKNRSDGRTCNTSCKIVEPKTPICSSKYNNKKVYTNNSTPYLKGTDGENLCDLGKLTPNSFKKVGIPITFTWGCTNGSASISSDACSLKQYRCGDENWLRYSTTGWIDNGNHIEVCDPTSSEWKNRSDGQKCNNSCGFDKAQCGEKNGTTEYNNNFPKARITVSDKLCGLGKLVEGSFSGPNSNGKYTWKCVNGTTTPEVSCNAQDLWCGDGEKNGTEQCDYKDTDKKEGWGGKRETCNQKCEREPIPQIGPVCNSSISGHTEYTTYSTEWINKNSGLCSVGKLTYFNSEWSTGSQRKFTWKCENDDLNITCTAKQERCGDGIKNKNEVCDPNDTRKREGWGDACSPTCNKAIYGSGVCGSKYNGSGKYQNINNPWITKNTQGLCDKGNVTGFVMNTGADHTFKWQCENHGNYSEQCRAKQEWCGDGKIKEGKEACDPKASEWINGKNGMICDNTCHTSDAKPVCASDVYKYKYTQTSDPWLNESMGSTLCKKGTYKPGSLKYSGTPRKFTWTCENAGASTGCEATQEWCGDGKVNGTGPDKESCDEGVKNGTKDSLCSKYCTTVGAGNCGPGNETTKYFSKKQENPWISNSTYELCPAGLSVGQPKIVGSDYHMEWTCTNANGNEKQCRAYQQYCGDGKYQSGDEQCDYKDPLETNRGSDGCSQSCEKVIIPSSGCDEVFHYTLRQGYEYIFRDIFHAKDANRRLYGNPVVNFVEPKDYNRGANPTFRWTNRDSNKKVSEGDSKKVVESTPAYHIYEHPDVRSDDNLYIEYDLQYANRENAPESRRKTHKECVYYQISRCGDGKKDTNWEGKKDSDKAEECDPGSEGTKVLDDGRICNSDCTIVEAPKGNWNMKKELKTTESVETGDILEWKITVWASGGNVKNLQIKDEMPTILSYVKNSVSFEENPDNIKITNETVTDISGGTNNKVEFKTTGTLQSGNKIVMVIKTKVNKMPEPGKEYQNVACSKPENEVEWKCDPEPLKGKCESEYAGKTFSNLTEGNYLCKVGKVGNFKFNTGENKWTWTCDNYSSKENCSAYKETSSKGRIEITKVLRTKKEVTKGETLEWKILVTAVDGYVDDVTIRDYLPNILSYNKDKSVKLASGVEMKLGQPTQGSDSTGKYVQWETTGRLNQGNTIELVIITNVDETPIPGKEYRNVACATTSNNTDWICDPAPIEGKCESEYAGQTFSNLTEGNYLCKVGKVGNFKFNTGENKWTWTCNNYDSSTGCYAYKERGTGKLEVVKSLIKPRNKVITGVGQEVEWKIIVRAVNGNVEMDWITDNLPKELKYKGYKTGHVPVGISISRTPEISEDGREIKWKTTGTLRKGEYIELRLYTTVDTLPNGTVKNVACAKPMTGDPICGEDWTTDLYIEKEVWDHNRWAKTTTGNSGDTIKYRIKFGNRGNTGAYVSVKDFLPKDIDVKESTLSVKYTDYSTGKGNDNQQPYTGRWEKVENVYINVYSGIYLNPKTEGLMTIIGTALHEEGDKHNRTNFACIYDDQGNKIACDDAIYNVEERVLCEKVTLSPESITVKYNETAKGTTNVTCKTSGGNADITIYCGSNKETKENTNSFTKKCTFEGEGSHDVRCEVDEDIDNSKCKATYTINKGNPPSNPPSPSQGPDRECVGIDVDYNQKDDQYEVTCHADEPVYFKINGCTNRNKESTERKKSRTFECETIDSSYLECRTNKEDRNSRYEEGNKKCEYTQDGKINPVQSCFNVNAGNFSIEEGEILPFYWNLERLPNIVGKNKVYVEAFGGDYGHAKDNIKDEGGSCSTEGAIAADSMVCTFGIYDGGNYFYGWKKDKNDTVDNPLYQISGPCLSSLTDTQLKGQYRLIDKWYDEMVATYCDKDCLSFDLANKGDSPIDERDPNTPYSDLLHSSVYYIENFGIGNRNTVHLGGMQDQARGMQAAADGSFEKSYGEYKIVLLDLKYLQCVDNAWQVKTGDLSVCQSNFALTNSYTVQKTPSGNLTASTDKLSKYRTMDGKKTFTGFVNNISTTEYNKNANVSKAMDDFIKKYEKLAVKVSGVTKLSGNGNIKKVPGKDIYFVDGNVTVKGKGSAIKKPFTLVQTNGNTTIEGNVSHNMMLLTKGDIIFSGDCTSDQKVKGIYYASGSLKRNNNLKKNNSIDNEVWCTNGGLHIQGVLIGNGFDNLMNKSRSNLNMWFKAQESEKKNIVMNGASVLIEYSPSIFTKSTMPPGAEDFTTALSIYRQ